jgi:hypothetical protein
MHPHQSVTAMEFGLGAGQRLQVNLLDLAMSTNNPGYIL